MQQQVLPLRLCWFIRFRWRAHDATVAYPRRKLLFFITTLVLQPGSRVAALHTYAGSQSPYRPVPADADGRHGRDGGTRLHVHHPEGRRAIQDVQRLLPALIVNGPMGPFTTYRALSPVPVSRNGIHPGLHHGKWCKGRLNGERAPSPRPGHRARSPIGGERALRGTRPRQPAMPPETRPTTTPQCCRPGSSPHPARY